MFRYLKWPVLRTARIKQVADCGEMHQTGKPSPRTVVSSTPYFSDVEIYEVRNKVIHTKNASKSAPMSIFHQRGNMKLIAQGMRNYVTYPNSQFSKFLFFINCRQSALNFGKKLSHSCT